VAAQIFQAPLQSIQRKLERDDHLRSAFRQVLDTTEPVSLSPVLRYELRALGVVQFKGDQVGLAGEFYRQYFQGTETRSATR
jgi:AAA-like domain